MYEHNYHHYVFTIVLFIVIHMIGIIVVISLTCIFIKDLLTFTIIQQLKLGFTIIQQLKLGLSCCCWGSSLADKLRQKV